MTHVKKRKSIIFETIYLPFNSLFWFATQKC